MYESVDVSSKVQTTPAMRPESPADQYAVGREQLAVGAENDGLETEANTMADQVMRMTAPAVQRRCSHCGAEEKVQRKSSVPFLQKKGSEGAGIAGEAVSQQIAASGGNGNRMDTETQDFMESRFGTDFSGVKIHTGHEAVQMSRELNAQAFTVGSDIYFNQGRYNPSSAEGKHLLAHELTHTVQQGNGIQKKIQRYVDTGTERIADDGKMVVEDHTKNAWALSAKIDDTNAVLSKMKSEISLKKLGVKRKQMIPGGAVEVELEKYNVQMAAGATPGDLKKNCGRACLQVLGHNVTGEREFVAVTKNKTTSEYTATEQYHADDQAPGGLTSTTEELSAHIYIKIMKNEFGKTLTRVDALKEWQGLDAGKKKDLSKKYGINEFAVPQVGQAITMGTEFDAPGFKDDRALGRANDTWNFHFGTPVVASGGDYTTVENFTGSSHDYYFSMFGPESKGQSWYDEQKKAGFGSDFTAMVVQHPSSLLGTVNQDATLLVSSPETFAAGGTGVLASLGNGVKVTITRKGVSWMKVSVTDGPHAGKTGWIMNKYFSQ